MASHLARRGLNLASHTRWKPCTPRLSGLVLNPRRCYAAARLKKGPDPQERTPEQVLEEMELLRNSEHLMPMDPWGMPVATMVAQRATHITLDGTDRVHIFWVHELFYPVSDLDRRQKYVVIPSFTSMKKNPSFGDHLASLSATIRNWVSNAASMRRMAKDGGFPWMAKTSPWSLQIFRAQSTSDSAWMAPFRKIALDTYERLNTAIAKRDEATVQRLSIEDMQAHYLGLTRKQDPSRTFVWKLHGERSPCRVLSVRSIPVHMGDIVPNSGSRLLTQILVRLDTLQSLQVWSKRGTLVHEQEPKRVVEYLVFQKRMWYNTPWVVRDVVYEGLELRHKSL